MCTLQTEAENLAEFKKPVLKIINKIINKIIARCLIQVHNYLILPDLISTVCRHSRLFQFSREIQFTICEIVIIYETNVVIGGGSRKQPNSRKKA